VVWLAPRREGAKKVPLVALRLCERWCGSRQDAKAQRKYPWRVGGFARGGVVRAKTQRRKGVVRGRLLMTENEIAKIIVDAAYKIHTTLGPGLLESVYEAILAYELDTRGLRVTCQQPIPVVYESVRMDLGFRADLIAEDKVIVELKSVEQTAPVHKKQLLTYLKVADKRLGLLINFGAPVIKDGISRLVNRLPE
jgi:GxxExxY protein